MGGDRRSWNSRKSDTVHVATGCRPEPWPHDCLRRSFSWLLCSSALSFIFLSLCIVFVQHGFLGGYVRRGLQESLDKIRASQDCWENTWESVQPFFFPAGSLQKHILQDFNPEGVQQCLQMLKTIVTNLFNEPSETWPLKQVLSPASCVLLILRCHFFRSPSQSDVQGSHVQGDQVEFTGPATNRCVCCSQVQFWFNCFLQFCGVHAWTQFLLQAYQHKLAAGDGTQGTWLNYYNCFFVPLCYFIQWRPCDLWLEICFL